MDISAGQRGNHRGPVRHREPPAHNLPTAIGRFLGLHLAFVVAMQLLLIARLPVLDRRFGLDRLTVWHRWTGFALFWLVLLHPAFILLGYSRADGISYLSEFSNLAKQTPVLLGMIAAVLVIVVAALSIRAARRVNYELWHAVHMLVYLVVVLAILHQLSEGTAFATNAITGTRGSPAPDHRAHRGRQAVRTGKSASARARCDGS